MFDHITIKTTGFQISSGTKNTCLTMIDSTGQSLYPGDLSVFYYDLTDFCLTQGKIFDILQSLAHLHTIGSLVRLGTERMNCRTLGFVEHLGLDKSMINVDTHLSAKSIDLSYQMSLRTSADIWIARHHSHTIHADRKKYGI